MIEALDLLAAYVDDWLFAGFVVFLRVGAAMTLFPAFGERSLPERVRLVLALGFTVIVAPLVLPAVEALPEGNHFYLVTEPVAGLAIGAVVRLLVLALQTAGSMAAQSTSLAQVFGGAGADPAPAIGHVLLVGGLALAVMTGLHVKLAELLVASYEVLPAGRMPGAEILSSWGLAHVARAFSLAFSLAAPFVVAALIYNVALGVINRAMPQLMVAFVGAPAITFGGLALLLLTAPIILSIWNDTLTALLAAPFGEP